MWDSAKRNKTISSLLAAGALASSLFVAVDNAGKVIEAADHIFGRFEDVKAPKVDFVQVRVADPQSKWIDQDRDERNYFWAREIDGYGSNDLPFAYRMQLWVKRARGEFACPGEFIRSDWCRKASRLYTLTHWQMKVPDPTFDLIIRNSGKETMVFTAIGVEVIGAEEHIVSAGDAETGKIEVSAVYEIEMPSAVTVRTVAHSDDEVSKDVSVRKRAEEEAAENPDLKLNPNNLSRGLCAVLAGSGDYVWTNVPITVTKYIPDPIRVSAGGVYRFNLVLRKYYRMPTDVLLRFVLRVDDKIIRSSPFYLSSRV